MKKPYEKPAMEMENFAITQTIAACSGVRINSLDYICVLSDPDTPIPLQMKAYKMVFMQAPCIEMPVDNSEDDGFCYFTGIGTVFNS